MSEPPLLCLRGVAQRGFLCVNHVKTKKKPTTFRGDASTPRSLEIYIYIFWLTVMLPVALYGSFKASKLRFVILNLESFKNFL